jgi:hypothetical protein
VFEELPANEGPIDENGSKINKTQVGNYRNKAAETIIKRILSSGLTKPEELQIKGYLKFS